MADVELLPKQNFMDKLGDCRDEALVDTIFGSVSEFARQVELHGNNFRYRGILVQYNAALDRHNFFRLKQK